MTYPCVDASRLGISEQMIDRAKKQAIVAAISTSALPARKTM
jgi:hypothetical protein